MIFRFSRHAPVLTKKAQAEMNYSDMGKYEAVLMPFRDEMVDYFDWEEELRISRGKTDLQRRPTTGLQLHTATGRLVCVRPGWKLPKRKRYWRNPEDKYGTVLTDQCEIELIEDGRAKIEIDILGNGIIGRMWPTSDKLRHEYLREICAVADEFLKARCWELFARSSQVDGRCVRCRKELTVDDSLSHGVGPECIKAMSWFSASSANREAYQTRFRSIDEPWEFGTDEETASNRLTERRR